MAVLLALVLGIQMSFVIQVPFGQAYAYTERQATVNASSLNVRSGPGTSYSRVTSVSKGASVTVINEVNGSDGEQWYQIRTGSGTGYVLGSYLRFPVAYPRVFRKAINRLCGSFMHSIRTGCLRLTGRGLTGTP